MHLQNSSPVRNHQFIHLYVRIISDCFVFFASLSEVQFYPLQLDPLRIKTCARNLLRRHNSLTSRRSPSCLAQFYSFFLFSLHPQVVVPTNVPKYTTFGLSHLHLMCILLRVIPHLLFMWAIQCAIVPNSRPLRHSVSHLLDRSNNTLYTPIFNSKSSHYALNLSLHQATINSATSPYFRYVPYPSHWNRFDTAWYSMASPHLPSLNASRHRLLLSSVRAEMGDGLGHMYLMYNFELFLAIRLQLTFTHRHSRYQSLTKSDPYAVDNFFGWGKGEVPREKVWSECALSYTYTHSGRNAHKCVSCESVATNGPLALKHVVVLPSFLVYNCTSKYRWSARCDQLAHQTLTANNKSHTVFQIPPGACDYEGTNTNVTETGPWFYNKYWRSHGRRLKSPWPSEDSSRLRTKAVRFDPSKLNIAVHVRRGDFFNETKRRMFPDRVFARTISDVLDIVDSVQGVFSKVSPEVHIYSEGRRYPGVGLTAHDVDAMDRIYYDENLKPRSEKYWEGLIKSMLKSDGRLHSNLRQRTKVKLHVSEDTLANMHEMISADVFIGSDSSMSLGPIYMLSRGVRLLVTHQLRPQDRLFATFDSSTGNITTSQKFLDAWILYEAGNGHSLLHLLQSTGKAKFSM